MCSASSPGVSMWPNITVTVERRPTSCAAVMISTQRADRQLVRADALAHAVVQHLGGGAGHGAQARLAQLLEDRVRRQAGRRRTMCATSIGQYACRWISGAVSFASRSQPQVVLEPPVGMDARLHADLGRPEGDRVVDAAHEVRRGRARRRRASACPTPKPQNAQPTVQMFETLMLRLTTNVTSVAGQLGAQLVGGLAHVLDHLGAALGEHRRQLPGRRARCAVAGALDRVAGVVRRGARGAG